MRFCKTVMIFEGPDGAGKTTLAKLYAERTGARYVHFGPMPQIGPGLARVYVEAMLPALLGYQDVILDRSWLSEVPYGDAYRSGVHRLGEPSRRMLERLAMRCGAIVVKCLPPWETVKDNFLARKEEEYLDSLYQLRAVYEAYRTVKTALPVVNHDYTKTPTHNLSEDQVIGLLQATTLHRLDILTAGNLNAPYVLVGGTFAEPEINDPLYQWPFASFGHQGCSQWFTRELAARGISEADLLWVNADQDLSILHDFQPKKQIFALGKEAQAALYRHKIPAIGVNHPQYHKRFRLKDEYSLFKYLKN